MASSIAWRPACHSLLFLNTGSRVLRFCGTRGAGAELLFSAASTARGLCCFSASTSAEPLPNRVDAVAELVERAATETEAVCVEHSLYRWFRHPIYLSFLGLIWFVPTMSYDHVLLTGIWTVYIFVGSWLKDERLQFYLGETYKDYRSRVPVIQCRESTEPQRNPHEQPPDVVYPCSNSAVGNLCTFVAAVYGIRCVESVAGKQQQSD